MVQTSGGYGPYGPDITWMSSTLRASTGSRLHFTKVTLKLDALRVVGNAG